ncbi:GNAT family N-acetyltransferase [Pontixanthobacter sp. CEM42]|uniref:GNAT family N-acetyltransferase n=1 Tax=Pontixanthobacter sp. CEM42 TaxID=2792077 RepID=UPI001ADF6F66|nr:GNAT family N-acetyltransferase [Pontixanthobacter sp. CEM42]
MEIETERLRLRFLRQDDFDIYADYYADPRTARFVGGQMSRDKAWRHMAAIVGHWSLKGFGQWAVEEKATGRMIGCIGLWEPEGWPELEVGYWLVDAAHGKGYATEATIAARNYAYENLGAKTLVSYIDPSNEPSMRVAERAGAWLDDTIELLDLGPHHVYRHPQPG